MDIEIIWRSVPLLVDGVWLTLQITTLSVLAGLCLAVPLSILRVMKNPWIWMPVLAFTFFFRGTPLLVQLFLIYYGSGQFSEQLRAVGLWQFFREPYFCGVLSLTLNTAAYTTEILRGAILGVPAGEIEAARACGMSGSLLYRRIIMPKAFRYAWPAYTNEVVFMLQATSLVSTITLLDITGVADMVANRSFAFYEMYPVAAAIYLVLVYGVVGLCRRIERHLLRHLRDVAAAP